MIRSCIIQRCETSLEARFLLFCHSLLSHCLLSVFPFCSVAPIRIPWTRRQDTKNILYMCQLPCLCSLASIAACSRGCNTALYWLQPFAQARKCQVLVSVCVYKKSLSCFVENGEISWASVSQQPNGIIPVSIFVMVLFLLHNRVPRVPSKSKD